MGFLADLEQSVAISLDANVHEMTGYQPTLGQDVAKDQGRTETAKNLAAIEGEGTAKAIEKGADDAIEGVKSAFTWGKWILVGGGVLAVLAITGYFLTAVKR